MLHLSDIYPVSYTHLIFLRSIFSPEYRIVEAADGMEGCDKALKLLPDIIISDVMMPEKDGAGYGF